MSVMIPVYVERNDNKRHSEELRGIPFWNKAVSSCRSLRICRSAPPISSPRTVASRFLVGIKIAVLVTVGVGVVA